jgi:hypothetical protein
MNYERVNAASIEINNRLYVVGGSYDMSAGNTIEYYEKLKGWTLCKGKMKTSRDNHGILQFKKNKIMVIGGTTHSDKYYLSTSTIEIYDCIKDEWQEHSILNSWNPYLKIRAINVNDKIMCFDGKPIKYFHLPDCRITHDDKIHRYILYCNDEEYWSPHKNSHRLIMGAKLIFSYSLPP